MSDGAIAQTFTLIALVAGFLFQYVREGRARRWDLEDRRIKAEELEARTKETNAELREALVTRSLEQEGAAARRSEELRKMVAHNTTVTTIAASETHDVKRLVAPTVVDVTGRRDGTDRRAVETPVPDDRRESERRGWFTRRRYDAPSVAAPAPPPADPLLELVAPARPPRATD